MPSHATHGDIKKLNISLGVSKPQVKKEKKNTRRKPSKANANAEVDLTRA